MSIKLFIGPMFSRKCLGKDTPILMFDGRVKMAQDIRGGDLLMGDDSCARTVQDITSGFDLMYSVTPSLGTPYVVTSNHILSVVNGAGDVKDISVMDFLKMGGAAAESADGLSSYGGYKAAVEFPPAPRIRDEFTLGHVIGSASCGVCPAYKYGTKIDREGTLLWMKQFIKNPLVRAEMVSIANSLGYHLISGHSTDDLILARGDPLTITQIGLDKFYGFELDGNGRFLLGDFTVTHNTSSMCVDVERYHIANKLCIIVKYTDDNRYDSKNGGLVSHAGHEFGAVPVVNARTLADVYDEINDYEVIGIDEVQFYPDNIEVIQQLANSGKIIIASGLDANSMGKSFARMGELIPLAEDVIKLKAVCMKCCAPASFTCRITTEDAEVSIGGVDKYLSVCRRCMWGDAPA